MLQCYFALSVICKKKRKINLPHPAELSIRKKDKIHFSDFTITFRLSTTWVEWGPVRLVTNYTIWNLLTTKGAAHQTHCIKLCWDKKIFSLSFAHSAHKWYCRHVPTECASTMSKMKWGLVSMKHRTIWWRNTAPSLRAVRKWLKCCMWCIHGKVHNEKESKKHCWFI